MSDPAVTEEVRALERLDLEGLRTAWRTRYGVPPKLRSVELLRLSLAWRIQSAAFGGLDAGTKRKLRGKTLCAGGGVGRSDHVSQGACIRREWRGEVLEVSRSDEGYLWRGETYPSLSAVAAAITGTKRNGPRFFGLREEEA